MRIVTCGKLQLDPRQIEDWARGEGFAEAGIRQECASAWALSVEADPNLNVVAADFSCSTESMGVQMPHMLEQENGRITFFLHGYRAGDAIYFRDIPLEAPVASEVEPALESRYLPPSFASPESSGRPFFAWRCLRCGGNTFSIGEIFAADGAWAAMTDRMNAPFTAITCSNCAWTEFYRVTNSEFRHAWTHAPLGD